jgi:hypothetical protein
MAAVAAAVLGSTHSNSHTDAPTLSKNGSTSTAATAAAAAAAAGSGHRGPFPGSAG